MAITTRRPIQCWLFRIMPGLGLITARTGGKGSKPSGYAIRRTGISTSGIVMAQGPTSSATRADTQIIVSRQFRQAR